MASSTVPSARTSTAVDFGSSQSCGVCGCVGIGKGLHLAHFQASCPPIPGGRLEREAIIVLRDDINNAVTEAMKAGQARRVSTLRMVNAAVLERETRGAERLKLADADIL